MVSTDIDALQTAPIDEPVSPQGLADSEDESLRERAATLVRQIATAEGAQEMGLIDSITHLGNQTQTRASSELDLLRTRVGEMLSQEGVGGEIAQGLVDLRFELDRISPDSVGSAGPLRSLVSVLPFISKTASPLKVLQKIAIRYEPVSRQIEEIETRLRNGRMVLTRDNVELRQLYEHVEQQRLPVQKNAYLGELVMDELQNLLDTTDDPQKANRSRLALQDVADRVQNLRILDEVFAQFFVGIEMTRRNNAQLGRAVERTLSVATNVVTVGLAIQTALSRQREIMEANTRTREFIGDLIVSNASAINRHTQEIGEVFKNPVIAMDKLTQAHNELVEAMETANRLRDEGFQIARENITNLRELTEDFQQRIGSVQEADSIESIEA